MVGRDQNPSYEFGEFALDTRERRLLYRGEAVLLTPKAFETLVALVENSGHVVTKDELIETVWPDAFVEESGLTRNISVLRKILDQTPGGKDFIETVPKVGYRFNPPVTLRGEEQEFVRGAPGARDLSGPQKDRRVVIGGLLAAVFGLGIFGWFYFGDWNDGAGKGENSPRTIAVLPFRPLSVDGSDRNLEIGLADALITQLSNLKRLAVKPTSQVRKYADGEFDSMTIGRELGVDAVLEGNIQRGDERIVVSVRLVRISDGVSLWAKRFEERAEDIFIVQDAIAEKIVSAMQVHIDAEEQKLLLRRYTENLSAFGAYIRGRSQLSEYSREGTLAALQSFEEALSFDPNYALARAGLATASAEMYLRFAPETEAKYWADRADREIASALAIDPVLAETHQALAAVYRKKDFNWEKVLEESARALELNPNLEQPHYYRAAAFYHLGLLDAAAEETARAERKNPQNRVDSLRAYGVIALYSQRYADAIASFEEVQRLSSKPVSDPHLAMAYFYLGDVTRAEGLARELSRDPSASASARAQALLALLLAVKGSRSEAEKILRSLESREFIDHHAAYTIGTAHAQLWDFPTAISWLKRASGTGLPCYGLYRSDPSLDILRRDESFQKFLNELLEAHRNAEKRYLGKASNASDY